MYGGPQLRPYVVEFIRGTGVRVNGVVVQDSGGNGPFSWVLPDDVAILSEYALIAGGTGGQGGGDIASPLSLGGGQGGPSGRYRMGRRLAVLPGATLTVTIGAGGAGGAVNSSSGTQGGNSSIDGVLPGDSFKSAGLVEVVGEGMFVTAAGASASAIATAGGGGTAAGAAGDNNTLTVGIEIGGTYHGPSCTGSPGGGGAASGAAGGAGGLTGPGFGSASGLDAGGSTAAGTNSGGISRGGGGSGGFTVFGRGGNGGSGAAGEASPSYGGGGGGGGGGFAGGAGGNGYCRITYWSAR
jgi:hypothetical protein